MVTDTNRHDEAILRLRVGLVTLFAPPLSWIKFRYLLVAVFRKAGRVAPGGILLDVDHSCFQGEVIRSFRHAKLLFTNLCNGFEPICFARGVGRI